MIEKRKGTGVIIRFQRFSQKQKNGTDENVNVCDEVERIV